VHHLLARGFFFSLSILFLKLSSRFKPKWVRRIQKFQLLFALGSQRLVSVNLRLFQLLLLLKLSFSGSCQLCFMPLLYFL